MSIYWEKRAEEILISRENESELYIDKIARIYKSTQNQINLEIKKIYNKYSENMELSEDKIKILLNTKESKEYYDNLLEQINTIKNKDTKKMLLSKYNAPAYNYRISRLEALKTDIYVKCKVIADKELEYSTQNYTNTIKNTYSDYIQAISNYKTGQAITFSNINNNVLNKILTTNWLGSNFSKRIWGNTEILAKNVNNTLQKGILAGLSNQKMSKELNDVMQTGTFNATRLIRTETNHFHNQAELQSYKDDGIIYYRYSAYLDNRTSEICKNLNGKVFKVESARTGNNHPPMHPFCRSTTLPVFEDEVVEEDFVKINKVQLVNKEKLTEEDILNNVCNKFSKEKITEIAEGTSSKNYKNSIEDKLLVEIIKNKGYDVLPMKLSTKDFEDYVKNNNTNILYRGTPLKEHLEQFINKDFYCGKGIYGSGTYFSEGDRGKIETRNYAQNNGYYIRATFNRADMKIINYDEDGLKDLVRDYKMDYSDSKREIVDNLGRYATLKDYDAIYVENRNHYVILNRSKLIVDNNIKNIKEMIN